MIGTSISCIEILYLYCRAVIMHACQELSQEVESGSNGLIIAL